MEIQWYLFSALFTSIIFISLFQKLWNWKPLGTQTQTRNLPPGPFKLPFVGNIHNMMGGALLHRRLTELANKFGPLMHLKLGKLSLVVASSPEMAEQIMKVHDIDFASRPYTLLGEVFMYNFSGIALAPYGEHWRQMRKIFMVELLSLKRVQSFRSLRQQEVEKMVREIARCVESQTPFNLTRMLFSLSNRIISGAAFGRKDRYVNRFIDIIKKVEEVADGFSVAELFPSLRFLQLMSGSRPQLEKLHREADDVLEDILREGRVARARKKASKEEGGEESEDLVDVLLNLQEHGNMEFQLTDDSIKAVLQDCIFAGITSTSATIEWTMSEMLRNPRVLRKAQVEVWELHDNKSGLYGEDLHELGYMNQIIRENFRMHPPLPLLLGRENAERCEINGHEIPAKSVVLTNAWAIGRDPRLWKDPGTFNPERFQDSPINVKGVDFELIPFGAGRRMCPGLAFGMANVEIVLANLVCHFGWKLPAGGGRTEELDMTEGTGSLLRRKSDLCLIPISRGDLILKC